MKVTSENMENCQIALNIEAEASELDKSLNEVYHRLVSKVSIPGFRKGKAPRAILEQHVGKKTLLDEALEHLIPQLYKEAIESQGLEPIAQPRIENIQTEPVTFKAIVSLKPEVELGDYHSIELKSEPVEIGDEEIQAVMEQIQREQALLTPVNRPVQFGDFVTIAIEASVEGKPFLNHKDMVYEVSESSALPLLGFAQSLADMGKNKEKSFTLTIPDNYQVEGFRGKECSCKVTVTEIKERELSELDDELAQSAGYDNFATMKEKVAANLRAKAEEERRLEMGQKALDAVIELSKVDYPPILEDGEIDEFLEDEARRFGYRKVEDYLKGASKTEGELREELRPVAKKRVINNLVLEKLAEEEKVEITSSEVDNKIAEITGKAEDKEKMKELLALPQVRESVKHSLHTQKTIDLLVRIAIGGDETKEE